MPMVWYIPPLSPVVDALRETGNDAEDAGNLFGALDALRIPIEYLAELFTAGDVVPVKHGAAACWRPCARSCATATWATPPDPSIPAAVGLTEEEMFALYRLLAIAKYEDRYVIPKAHTETAENAGGVGVRSGLRRRLGHVRAGSVR